MRNILAAIAGLIIGQVIIVVTMSITTRSWDIPESARDTEQTFKMFVSELHYSQFAILILGFVLGTFAASLTANKISRQHSFSTGLVTTGFLLIAIISFHYQLTVPRSVLLSSVGLSAVSGLLASKL